MRYASVSSLGSIRKKRLFVFDVPLDVPPHASIVIAQASGVERTIGACAPIENSDAARGTADQILDPALTARSYMRRVENRQINTSGKITVQNGPSHGALSDLGRGAWLYSPADGYFGTDRATVVVEGEGVRISIVYYFNVVPIVREAAEDGYEVYQDKEMCPEGKGEFWRIAEERSESQRLHASTGTPSAKFI
jgi:hypothetical protein